MRFFLSLKCLNIRTVSSALLMLLFAGALSACEPAVGSDEWCQFMKDKPKGDWTANEAADFTEHCVF